MSCFRLRPCVAILIVAAVAALAPVDGASVASITGKVQYVGPPVAPKKLPVTVDQFVCGTDKDDEEISISAQRGLRNVVVSLASPPPGAQWQFSTAPVFLDQRQCVFIPRVTLVPAGGTIEFLNSDRLLHNIHSAGRANTVTVFNRTQPRGRTIPITFAKPEIVRIDCDLHGWMRAWVVVMEHPFYAVTASEGEFTIPNLPPGKYALNVWHESLGTTTKEVTVGESDAATVIEMGRR
jgi:plastocyanin